MPHPLHEQVRRAFNYRCGYCGVTEVAAGGQLKNKVVAIVTAAENIASGRRRV
ncbi:MAG: hypothetical protein ACREEM_27375 [Blastocatellia bacterium]